MSNPKKHTDDLISTMISAGGKRLRPGGDTTRDQNAIKGALVQLMRQSL